MLCDGLLERMAWLGSPGVDEVRWRKPVRPDTLLSVRYTAQEKRILASRPDVGVSKVLVELVDSDGEVLCTWLTNQLTRMRHPAPAAAARPAGKDKPAALDLWARRAGERADQGRRLLRGPRHRRDLRPRLPHFHA